MLELVLEPLRDEYGDALVDDLELDLSLVAAALAIELVSSRAIAVDETRAR